MSRIPAKMSSFWDNMMIKRMLSFIPAFYEKDNAQQCLIQLITEKGKKYEAQAILFEELAKDAAQHGFSIFMLNADGEILEEIAP